MLRTCLLAFMCLALVSCTAGDPDDVHQRGFRSQTTLSKGTIFSPLDLPTPTRLRTASGLPGPDYWQQQADYTIAATFDAQTKTITAVSTLTYTNNSPEPIDYLWFHLEQNLYRAGSIGERTSEPDTRFANRKGFCGGFTITSVKLSGDIPDKGIDLPHRIHDAVMRVDLPKPLGSRGGRTSIAITYSFPVPDYGSDRMGIQHNPSGDVYEIAQWFPAVCKFDDVHGWNTLPYLGQGEFYTDFGNFDVSLTVPRTHIVAATGVLQNPLTVLTETQIERLNKARASKDTVQIITPDEVNTPGSRPAPPTPRATEVGAQADVGPAPSSSPAPAPTPADTLTWHFKAQHVRTFAWASSAVFLWDASFAANAGKETNGKREGALCMSMYPKEALPLWAKATEMLRFSIEHYGEKWFAYPYPVATNINGIAGGMEYPMIIFCEDRDKERDLYGVTTHEIGHNWFPMTVSTDERRHAWMDEGFNTFINQYSDQAWFHDEQLDVVTKRGEMIQRMLKPDQQPIETAPDQLLPKRLGFLQYRKVAVALVLLREVVLGPERFDPAFRRYLNAWAFKSPQPADFYRCMEDAAGMDLAWFWRGFFRSTGTLDQSIDGVAQSGENATLRFSNRGKLVMPVPYRATFTDGTTQDCSVPVEAWFTSDRILQHINLRGPDDSTRHIASIEIDPVGYLPDTDLSNNRWPR